MTTLLCTQFQASFLHDNMVFEHKQLLVFIFKSVDQINDEDRLRAEEVIVALGS